MVVTIETMPAFLGAFKQFEDHRERRPVGQASLRSKLETIGNGLRRTVHLDLRSFDEIFHDCESKGFPRDPDNSNGRILDARRLGSGWPARRFLYQLRSDKTGTRGVGYDTRKEAYSGQIVNLLRQVEVGVGNGKTLPQACKEAEIVGQTYYRWRKEYGGLKVDQARRLKELEQEKAKLKRLVSELSLEKLVLKDIASGNF